MSYLIIWNAGPDGEDIIVADEVGQQQARRALGRPWHDGTKMNYPDEKLTEEFGE